MPLWPRDIPAMYECHIGLALGLYKGIVSDLWKVVEIPTHHVGPPCIGTWSKPNIYLDQPITMNMMPTDRRPRLLPYLQFYSQLMRNV